MQVKIDLSGIARAELRAKEALRRVPQVLHREVSRAAREASRTHPYRNRTGNLSRETKAVDEDFFGTDAATVLTAETEYAEYVRRRGLMTIDRAASNAENAIEQAFLDIAEEIGG